MDLNVIHGLNKEISDKYNVIPVKEDEKNITLLGYNIKEDELDYLKFIYRKKVILREVSEENFKEVKNMIFTFREGNTEDNIIFKGIEDNASDIHFEPQGEWVNIRHRINGTLIRMHKIPNEEYVKVISKIKLMSGMDIAEKRKPQDGKSVVEYNGKKYDLRVSTIPVINGEKLVVRILYKKNEFMNTDNLSLMEDQKNKINKLLKLKHGMVVINGPTGSGKSTTLYALLNSIDKEGINISTIEDPVEFTIEGITQTNVNEKVGLTFANGLKHILRQDPDVILIGEIRDEETAKIAIRASITGHKVYSTIHANSGNEVFNRLLDMGVEGYLVKEGVSSIITQRLVRKICEKCKVKIEFKNELVEKLKEEELSLKAYYKGTGCEMCNWTGNNGRKAICEIIFPREYKSTEDITWGEELLKACFTLVKKGEISLEEYYLLKECEGLDVWV